jgi:hypothetical protein
MKAAKKIGGKKLWHFQYKAATREQGRAQGPPLQFLFHGVKSDSISFGIFEQRNKAIFTDT